MTDPRIYLAVDNCFACKRWVKPIDWMKLIKDMGLNYVEQSADTECDPLYMGGEYMAQWIDLVRRGTDETGVVVKNLYSGHGTYATCGLTHWHDGVRLRFRDEWMKPQAETAAALGAGFGFFAHGIELSDMQSAEAYNHYIEQLYDDLAELARHARSIDLPAIGLEQMYTPHMPPWTILGTETLLRQVYARANAPMYITVDLGHMNGQQYFQMPTAQRIAEALENWHTSPDARRLWVGTEHAHALLRQAAHGQIDTKEATQRILDDAQAHAYLFAQPQDGDVWRWTERLGRFSPIIHLQQSDGKSSPHWPFTDKYNAQGIVSGEELVRALKASFARPDDDSTLPPAVDEVVLTLEPFTATAANPYQAAEDIAQSVTYWRRFIPRDGMRLSEL